MHEKDLIRVGVIGAGRIGKIHARNLKRSVPGATVAAIVDINAEAAAGLIRELEVPVVGDHRHLLDDPMIDAVAICASTDTHTRLIIEAAEAGKHIFCEKPIDFSLARIDEALRAVARAGVKLQVGFNRRFDRNFSKVRETVASGQIGVPHLLRISSRDPEPPSLAYAMSSGGMFVDMTIHDFDMARFLVGREVEEIYTAASVLIEPRLGEIGDTDTAITTLRFEGGAVGAIDNSRQAVYGYDQRVEVFGSGGMVAASNETSDTVEMSNGGSVTTSKPLYFFLERYAESFVVEMRAFVDSIRKDTPPLVGGCDGRMPVLMATAARKSYLENRPVKLSEVDV